MKHHYLESDAETFFGTTDLRAIPDPVPDDELPPPGTIQALARHAKGASDEPVVRYADSPALYGPGASKTPKPYLSESVTPSPSGMDSPGPQLSQKGMPEKGASVKLKGRDFVSSTTPSSVGPRRPGSQQSVVRPGSAAVSSTGDIDVAEAMSQVGQGIDFATELETIGKINLMEQRLHGALPQRQGASSSTPGVSRAKASPSPSPTLITPEEYEAVARAHPENESQTATGKPLHVPYTPDVRAKLAPGVAGKSFIPQKPMVLKDYQLLAEACQRAGRARMEGHAYYKIGELLAKNKATLPKSVTYFKRYLNLSRRLNDLQGEAKALNCLGIVHHEMGGESNYHIAMEYHRQHAEIADAAGIFIANTNLGLLHAKLGDTAAATEAHKQALQYAVRAGDRAAESLALVNLGQAGAQKGDFATARVCVERHLELSTTLHDNPSSCEAYEQLGTLAAQRHDMNGASENLLMALDMALRENDQVKAQSLRCQIGMVQGMMALEERMKGMATSMGKQ